MEYRAAKAKDNSFYLTVDKRVLGVVVGNTLVSNFDYILIASIYRMEILGVKEVEVPLVTKEDGSGYTLVLSKYNNDSIKVHVHHDGQGDHILNIGVKQAGKLGFDYYIKEVDADLEDSSCIINLLSPPYEVISKAIQQGYNTLEVVRNTIDAVLMVLPSTFESYTKESIVRYTQGKLGTVVTPFKTTNLRDNIFLNGVISGMPLVTTNTFSGTLYSEEEMSVIRRKLAMDYPSYHYKLMKDYLSTIESYAANIPTKQGMVAWKKFCWDFQLLGAAGMTLVYLMYFIVNPNYDKTNTDLKTIRKLL